MNERLVLGSGETRLDVGLWVIESRLNLGAFRKLQGVFDVDTEISNGALNLRMTEQDLNGSQIVRRLVCGAYDAGHLRKRTRERDRHIAATA